MNPLTIILILSIGLGVSLILNIIFGILAKKSTKQLNEACEELATYDNLICKQKETIKEYIDKFFEKDTEIDKLQLSLKQYDFKFNEAIRLNNESEQGLKDIIAEHDNEMRAQREKFDKLLETYFTKAEVIDFVTNTYIYVKGNNKGVKEYIKEFKANL